MRDITVCLSYQAGRWGEASGTDVLHTVHQNGRSVRGRAAWRSKGVKKARRRIPPKHAIHGVRSNGNPHSRCPESRSSAPLCQQRQMFPFPKMSPFCSSFTYMPTLGINLYWKGVCGESPDQILWGPQSWDRRTPCSQGLHGIFGEIR